MTESEDAAELLFFDTFSHEVDTDINLDLVQFTKPVLISQVRIIPLGARVQADFPGGVRLGATNPSKFDIEFFVNDLGVPGVSTFQSLGHLQYNQNDCIHLECTSDKIPTDGLVLRGLYSTITLAVYGTLTKTMSESIASPPPSTCEQSNMDEICNLSNENRSGSIQDEPIKEDWKEPIASDVAITTTTTTTSTHVHKTSTSDYERDDGVEFGITREREQHYHQTEDERERRLRKTSHSSEQSASSRNRTHSESNEREFLRLRNERSEKTSSRDWSRSPEYQRQHGHRKRSERSRSDADDTHKWPRTPPATIDSPSRPRSPDTLEYSEDVDVHHKLKVRPYMRSNESLNTSAQDSHILDDDDTPGTPGEQFEPILSDDEIIGDDADADADSNAAPSTIDQTTNDEFETEIKTAAAVAESAINEFDPFKMHIKRFESNLLMYYSKELENLKLLFKKFALQTKSESLKIFKDNETTVDERENFVFLCEQLINQLSYLSQNYKCRNFVLQQFFQSDAQNLQRAFSILQIALDFDAALAQPQPAFKIRHIKVGARLAELLGGATDFIEYIFNEQKFDPFNALFELYKKDYMALSIKLMILKAIYTLLDTNVAFRKFLESKPNGYQMIIETLQQTQLTRTKYALRSIIKKMNLNEALGCIYEYCTKLFVMSNYYTNEKREPYMIIEQAMGQVLEAINKDSLAYQQPKRFLPVSKKFEIVQDATAQRILANSLQAYFGQNHFGESLLLLLSSANELPQSLLLRCLDLLEALLQISVGVDYFVDDCFPVTRLIIAILLGIDDLPNQEDTTANESMKIDNNEKVKSEPLKSPSPSSSVESANAATTSETAVTTTATATTSIKEIELKTEIVVKTEIKTTDDADEKSPQTSLTVDSASPEVTSSMPSAKSELSSLQKLGFAFAYKVQTRYHLDAIVYTATSNDYDAIRLAEHLHALYSQTCNPSGRLHTVDVICLYNNIQIFLELIKKEQRLQAQRHLLSPGSKYKSPVLSYAVDLVDCCVRYCEQLDYLIEHGHSILELAKNHETFEPSVSAVLQEMFVYLKPLEAINIFSYEDITPLVEIITRSLEYLTTFPGNLIMALRILRYLALSPNCRGLKSGDAEELKYRYVTLQFYAADGVQILIQILEKLCSYFEQPGLHTPALMTMQGLHCCQIILPTLQILRQMLSYAIQCRNTEFKDLTAIDHLMKTYFLMHYFPARCHAANEVKTAKEEIIKLLLAYTQPNEQDEESLHKSLWTQMLREILKNIDGPHTFIPGLQIITELLPLPLPIPLPVHVQLTEAQTQRLITERKLWSAHLHPQSAQIAKLIETIAPSSLPILTNLMIRVCVQLADLAPNMTLLISKTLTDLLCNEWTSALNVPTAQLARLLKFFAALTCYASLKSSALSILSGKLWDLFQALLTAPATDISLKCQISVYRILESFLDTEISLISNESAATPELKIAAALPPKELMPRIVEVVFGNLMNADVKNDIATLALRILLMMTQHDITFYHLSLFLKQKSQEFRQWLKKLATEETSLTCSSTNLSIIESTLLLIHALMNIEENSDPNSFQLMRTLKLLPNEMAPLIVDEKIETIDECIKTESQTQSFERLCALIEQQNKHNLNETILNQFKGLVEHLKSYDANAIDIDEDTNDAEPQLPQAEGIVTQYASRFIFTNYDKKNDAAKLTANYWLNTLYVNNLATKDVETQFERVPCDLNELANTCLPPETNLTTDCKRVLHLSASPQSNRERTPTAPCFRTRRVEVEPTTGRPEKKLYVTPVRGRGYVRALPTRGDLFRSRPPNTSRPPSLHVDDFLALETCGAQPTGPTGYNKIPPMMRGGRIGRSRGARLTSMGAYRKPKLLRTASPSTWTEMGGSPLYRGVDPHFVNDPHYVVPPHFVPGRLPRARGLRARPYFK